MQDRKRSRKHNVPVVSVNWVDQLTEGIVFPEYQDRAVALAKLKLCLGNYVDLEKNLQTIDAFIFQNFTQDTAANIWARLSRFEDLHLRRRRVVESATCKQMAYDSGTIYNRDNHGLGERFIPPITITTSKQ